MIYSALFAIASAGDEQYFDCVEPYNPEHYFDCPISKKRMTDPVFAADGHTYDRKSIQKWFDEGRNTTSPLVENVQLPSLTLTPNHQLRELMAHLNFELVPTQQAADLFPIDSATGQWHEADGNGGVDLKEELWHNDRGGLGVRINTKSFIPGDPIQTGPLVTDLVLPPTKEAKPMLEIVKWRSLDVQMGPSIALCEPRQIINLRKEVEWMPSFQREKEVISVNFTHRDWCGQGGKDYRLRFRPSDDKEAEQFMRELLKHGATLKVEESMARLSTPTFGSGGL